MSERRGMKALELWCKKITDGYAGVKVENMTTSWRDGLAFCALIHHFRPDLIDFQSLEKGDVYRNNELAFRTAERHLGIPALLDAEDMALYEVPDRLSILTYLSQFYQVFASQGNSPVKRSPEPADRSLVLGSTVQTPPPKDLGCAIRRKEPCFKCGLPVFLAQRLIVENRLHHRTCFRCARCNAQLSLANYYETVDGVYCCETCPDEEKVAAVNNNAKNSINNMAGGETLDDNLTVNSNNKKDNISLNNSSKNYDQFTTTAIDKTEELVSSRRESLVGVRKMMFENIANNKSSTSSQSKLESSSALISPKIVEESKLTDDDKVVIIKAKKGSLCDNDKFKNSDDSDINVKNNISDSNSKSRSRRNSCSISSDNVDLVVDFVDNKDSDNEPIDPGCKNVNIEDTTQVTKVLSDINDKTNFKDVSYIDENHDNISEDVINNDKAQIIDDNSPSVSNVIPSIVIVDDKSTIAESTNDEISNDTYVEMKSVYNDDIDEPIYEEIKENRSSIKSNVSMDMEDVKINDDKIDTDSINTDKDDKEIVAENIENIEEVQDKLNEVKLETGNENIPENVESESENNNQIDIPAIVTDKDNSLEIIDKEQLKDDENDYPEGLNPFGDEEEGEDDKKNQTSSTNPFESDMDDDDEDVKQSVPKPAARTVRKESESDRLNPFWSGSDEENDENSALISAPVPLPRKLKTPQLSPTPIPRSSRHKVTSSIGSASSSGIFSESPSPRKKKLPAPAPPSQNSTLRARKPRPPPPPPPPASQTSRCTTPSIASDAISIERSPPSTPKLREKLSEAEFDKQQLINEVAECIKNKSTFGQWKRKKGQAPPPPIPQRRTVKPMPLKQVHQELADIEVKQQELERQGVSLEQTIRDKFDQEESMTPFVEELVLQLFELVNEKNELFRRQAELMYLRRQHNLEEEQADLEYQIRCLMLCPEHNKTDSDKEREEELIKRLVEVVERRNSIIQCLDMDRLREAEEDKSVSAQLGSFSAVAIGSEIDLTNLDKKDKKSKKDKKKQKDSAQSSNSNSSLDRDINNTEKLLKHKKLKKKWFTLSHSKKP